MANISNVLINIRVAGQNALREINQINTSFIVLNATLALTAKQMSQTSAEFEKEMRNVNSIAQESEETFKRLSQELRILSKDPFITDGPIGLAKGMLQLVSSGFEASEALNMVGVASKAASAGLTNTQTSVHALSALMNAYNQKTLKDSINFSDDLFRIVDKGIVSFEGLANNLGTAISFASAAKVGFKDVGAAFIELTRAGVNVSEAETAIANMIRSIADPDPKALMYAKMLGVELGDTALQTKGLEGVMKDLAKATNGSLSIMSKLIPESRAAKAALTLTKNDVEGFTRALGEMATASGTTEKALSQQSKSFAFDIQKLKSSIENLKIEYGDIINQALKPLFGYLQFFIEYLLNLDENTKKLIIQTGAWALAIGTTLIALKGFNLVMGTLLGLASKTNIALAAGIGFFKLLHESVTNIKNATSGWNKALKDALENYDILGQKVNLLKGLENIDLFGKVGNYLEAKKSEIEAKKQEAELDEQKKKNLKTIQELMQKEIALKKEGKALTADEQLKYSQALTGNITFASTKEDRNRLKEQALLRKQISEDLFKAEKAQSDKEKKDADDKARANQKRLENLQKQQELNKKAEEEAERKAKEYQNNREQGLKSIKDLHSQLTSSINQNTMNSYNYQRSEALKDLKSKLSELNDLKKYNIDTTNEVKLAWKYYYSEISKIANEESKEKKEKLKQEKEDYARLQEDKINLTQEAYNFIAELNGKSARIGATDKEKAHMDLIDELNDIYSKYEKTKESMSKMLDKTGKRIYSHEDIKAYSEAFSKAYNEFATKQKSEISKIGNAKPFLDDIEKIKDAMTDLGMDEDLKASEKLSKEKDSWNEILKITEEALSQKANLEKNDIENIEKLQDEAKKALGKNLRDTTKLAKQEAKEREKTEKELAEKIQDENIKTAKNISSTFVSTLDNMFPGISKFFDHIIEKNSDAREEIIQTGIAIARAFGGAFGLNEKDLNSMIASSLPYTPEKKVNTTSIASNQTNILPKTMQGFSEAMQGSIFKASGVGASDKFISEMKNFGNLTKNEIKAIGDESSVTGAKTTQAMSEGAKATAELSKQTAKASIDAVGFGMAIEGVAKGFNSIMEEGKKLLTGQIKSAEDLQESNMRIAKSMPGGIGFIAEIIDIPRQAEKAKKETEQKLNELKATLSGNKADIFKNTISGIQLENISTEEKGFKTLIALKESMKNVTNEVIKAQKFDNSLIKDRKAFIEANYKVEVMEANLIDDKTERTLRLKEVEENKRQALLEFDKTSRELDIELTTDKIKNIDLWYNNELINLKNSQSNWELYNKSLQKLDREVFQKKSDYFIELNKLIHKNQELQDDEGTKAVKKAQDDLAEIDKSSDDLSIKEQKRIAVKQTLTEALKNINLNYYDDIEKVMSKYHDKELKRIKENHSADYKLIQDRERKIKENQNLIDKLNYELEKINKEFDKRLSDKGLTTEASSLFQSDRSTFMAQNNGIDLANLLRTPVTEFERMVSSAKEQIEYDFASGTITADERAEKLKNLALQQNVFYGELSKGIEKGTKEYDKYIKAANDGFRDYKSAVKDSIEAQKQNRIELGKFTEQIDELTSKNSDMQQEVNQANNNINKDIDSLSSKFKTATGDWVNDINLARKALQGISIDSKAAIEELDKVVRAKDIATTTNVSTVKATPIPVTTKNNTSYVNTKLNVNGIKGALPGETEDQTIERFKREDAAAQRASNTVNTVASGAINITKIIEQDQVQRVNNVASGMFDIIKNLKLPQFSQGGIFNGSASGSPAILHGKELILNERQGDNLAWLYKMAVSPQIPQSNTSTVYAPTININGSQLSETELTRAVNKALDQQRIKKNISYL